MARASLLFRITREVDCKIPEGITVFNCLQIVAVLFVVSVRKGHQLMDIEHLSKLPQDVGINPAISMWQITSHVMAEHGAGLKLARPDGIS